MSKISAQKALEAYPKAPRPYYDDHILDRNVKCRAGYIKGYDQAMQDFLEKAHLFISCRVTWTWEQFKRYMEQEYFPPKDHNTSRINERSTE